MQNKSIRPLKIMAYFFLIMLVFVIQTSSGIGIKVFSYNIDLLPVIVASVALAGGPAEGAIVGFLVGVFYDLAGVRVEGILPAYYLIFGIVAGYLGKKYLKKTISATVILTICSMLIVNATKALFYLFLIKNSSAHVLFKTLCAEILISAILSPIIFVFVCFIDKKLALEEE